MEHLDGILKITEGELGAIVNNGRFRSRDEIDSVYKLIDIAKDVYCIWEYEEEMGDSYDSYKYDSSYARGRRKRDSMGRYARDSHNSYRYSRDGYIDQLRSMMDSAPDEQTRQSLQRMIDQM